jgi:hypothetical protein
MIWEFFAHKHFNYSKGASLSQKKNELKLHKEASLLPYY